MLKEELNTKSPSFVVVYCVTLYCVSVAVCSVYTGKGRDRLTGRVTRGSGIEISKSKK